jgi:purine-binding chemotaxis protein CheW
MEEIAFKEPETAAAQKKAAKVDKKITELIVFQLGDEEYGANINQVRDIIRVGSITGIPDSPDFIQGVTNVRGEIAVVINLKKRFALKPRKQVLDKHIVMTMQETNLFGLVVDEVKEVLRIPESEIKTTPGLVTKIDRVYINGIITFPNRLIMLLDLSKVLQEDDLKKLSALRLNHNAESESEDEEPAVEAAPEEQTPAVRRKRGAKKTELPAGAQDGAGEGSAQ